MSHEWVVTDEDWREIREACGEGCVSASCLARGFVIDAVVRRHMAEAWAEGVLHCEPDGLNQDPNPYAVPNV